MIHWTNLVHDTYVPNVQGGYVVQTMTKVVEVESVHESVRSCKLQATPWVGPINFGMALMPRPGVADS